MSESDAQRTGNAKNLCGKARSHKEKENRVKAGLGAVPSNITSQVLVCTNHKRLGSQLRSLIVAPSGMASVCAHGLHQPAQILRSCLTPFSPLCCLHNLGPSCVRPLTCTASTTPTPHQLAHSIVSHKCPGDIQVVTCTCTHTHTPPTSTACLHAQCSMSHKRAHAGKTLFSSIASPPFRGAWKLCQQLHMCTCRPASSPAPRPLLCLA